MILKRGDFEIEITTLPGQKRPSLLVLRDRNLHSKVGMMMDEKRAEEFMDYLNRMIYAPSCPACGGKLVWQSDFTFEDYGYEGDGIVSVYQCITCGADIEVSTRVDSVA